MRMGSCRGAVELVWEVVPPQLEGGAQAVVGVPTKAALGSVALWDVPVGHPMHAHKAVRIGRRQRRHVGQLQGRQPSALHTNR